MCSYVLCKCARGPLMLQEVPADAIQVVRNKATLACSTDELLSLNERVKVSGAVLVRVC